MQDDKIVDMYWARSEDAISETSKKYGRYCMSIAYNILRDAEDSKECVNDTYLHAWNSMPDNRPNRLSVFLGKITRNLALTKWEHNTAQKRGGGQMEVVLEELGECVSGSACTEDVIDRLVREDLLNAFLQGLGAEMRDIFVARYWQMYSVAEIARLYHVSESKVKTSLHRMRNALRETLEREGVF